MNHRRIACSILASIAFAAPMAASAEGFAGTFVGHVVNSLWPPDGSIGETVTGQFAFDPSNAPPTSTWPLGPGEYGWSVNPLNLTLTANIGSTTLAYTPASFTDGVVFTFYPPAGDPTAPYIEINGSTPTDWVQFRLGGDVLDSPNIHTTHPGSLLLDKSYISFDLPGPDDIYVRFDSVTFSDGTTTSVPEPAGASLLLAGLAAMAGV